MDDKTINLAIRLSNLIIEDNLVKLNNYLENLNFDYKGLGIDEVDNFVKEYNSIISREDLEIERMKKILIYKLHYLDDLYKTDIILRKFNLYLFNEILSFFERKYDNVILGKRYLLDKDGFKERFKAMVLLNVIYKDEMFSQIKAINFISGYAKIVKKVSNLIADLDDNVKDNLFFSLVGQHDEEEKNSLIRGLIKYKVSL